MSQNYTMPTRIKRKPFPWKRWLSLFVVTGGIIYAWQFPAVQDRVLEGPLKPYLAIADRYTHPYATIAWEIVEPATRPFHFAAQQVAIVQKDQAAAKLRADLAAAQTALGERDKQIKKMESDNAQSAAPEVAAQPAATPNPSPSPLPADIKQTAAYWAQMDPEKAADVAQRLPQQYVSEVFAAMPADQVGEIMNALPPPFAAKLARAAEAGERAPAGRHDALPPPQKN